MSLEVDLALERGALTLAVKLSVGRVLAVVGPNASGKTTLLRAILGVVPSRGRIALGEVTLQDGGVDLPTEERALGYVPQDYALFPHLSVRDNVGFGARDPARAEEELARFELLGLAARRPATLSGGERQRVALARALATSPRALLLDEPLAALDVSARQKIRASLGQTLRRLGLPALVVTHDPVDAAALADQIAVLEQGRIVQTGTAAELRSSPASPFVADLFGSGTGSPPSSP